MEIFLLVIVIFLLILIKAESSSKAKKIDHIEEDLFSLRSQIENLIRENREGINLQKKPNDIPSIIEQPKPVEFKPDITGSQVPDADIAGNIFSSEEKKIIEPTIDKPSNIALEENKITTPTVPTHKTLEHSIEKSEESWFRKWLRENPDMERFIGENLMNKIGIAILVLGISFFVKYAIDRDWINETGRVAIGFFCGSILIAVAHLLHKNYRSFSSVLVGGGLAVFYFTTAYAFREYELMGQTTAFIVMVIITFFAIVLSVLYDRIELGIISAIGGFITPFLVSTGTGNYIVLFTYLSILNAGLIALAYYKRWRVLNFISFIFTSCIFAGWIIANSDSPSFSYTGTFAFGTCFYIMFIVMNVIHHVSRGSALKAADFIIILSINLGYYASGIYLLNAGSMENSTGIFTGILGLVNLTMTYLFFKRTKADKNFLFLLIGITLSFISLIAPTQLKGHYITLFWAVEGIVLIWLSGKTFIKLLKIAALLLSAVTLISLFIDLVNVYRLTELNAEKPQVVFLAVIINKGFVTGIFTAISFFVTYRILIRTADTFYIGPILTDNVRMMYLIASGVLFFLMGILEINYQFTTRFPGINVAIIYLQLYVFFFLAILITLIKKFKTSPHYSVVLVFNALSVCYFLISIDETYKTEIAILTSGNYKSWFIGYWLAIIILIYNIAALIKYIRTSGVIVSEIKKVLSWIISIGSLIVISVAAKNIIMWVNFSDANSLEYARNLYNKAGLSIIWGLAAFTLIWLGIKKDFKPLRVIALFVFGITLLKLFVYDIRNIPVGGKIAAFILLGIILLVISFMYQRLKKVFIENNEKK